MTRASFDPEAEGLAPASRSTVPTDSSMAVAPESGDSASTSISRQVIGPLSGPPDRVPRHRGGPRRPGQGYHGPFGIEDGHRMQRLTCRDVLNLIGQPGRHAAAGPVA